MFSYCLMDHVHSRHKVESYQLMEMMNMIHYILSIIDAIIKTYLLWELKREKTKKLLSEEKVIGDNFSKGKSIS